MNFIHSRHRVRRIDRYRILCLILLSCMVPPAEAGTGEVMAPAQAALSGSPSRPVMPAPSAPSASAAPGLSPPLAHDRNAEGKIVVSGLVPDNRMKAALLARLSGQTASGQLVDALAVGEAQAPPEWQALLPKLVVPGLTSVRRGSLHIEGRIVTIQGKVASAGMAETIAGELGRELPPGYTLRNQLQTEPADQVILDRTLSNRVVEFQNGSAALTPAGRAIVDEMIAALKKLTPERMAIIGHTDNQGTPAANLHLSQARADAVKAYLVENGMAASGIRTAGMGAAQPVASNASEDGRRRNRRIEFRVE
jgi:OOP family OmpA-OmpF porin